MTNANITYTPLPGKGNITFLVSSKFYTIHSGSNSFDSLIVAAIGAACLKDTTLLSYVNSSVLVIDGVTAPNPGGSSSGGNSGSSGSSGSGGSSGSSGGTSSSSSVINTGGGRKIILLIGQSNCEGEGAGIDLNFDYPDSRISQYPPVTAYANKIIEASEPLIHQGSGVAGKIGFGLSFAKRYVLENPTAQVLLITCAYGGTGFTDNHWNPGNDLFSSAVSQTNAVLAVNSNNQLVGILWHQGENDIGMGRSAYQAALIAMINAMRSQITGATNVPFILGQLAQPYIAGDPVRTSINEAIKEIPALLAHTYTTDSTGLTTESDNTHFSAVAQRTFGLRYFSSLVLASSNTLQAPVTPTGLTAPSNTIANTSAVINWNQDTYSFKWEYQIKKQSDSGWGSSSFTNTPSVIINSLLASTAYNFQVRAVNANGNSSWSTALSFSTTSVPAGNVGTTTSGVVPKVFIPARTNDVLDKSGNGHNGVLQGGAAVISDPTFSSPALKYVLQLNGNQWMTIPLGCASSYTKMMRIYVLPNNTANVHLLGDPANSDSTKINDYYMLLSNGSDHHQTIAAGHGGTEYAQDYQYFITGLWQHIAVSYDNTAKLYKMYYNGANHGGGSGTPANFAAGGSTLFVGHPNSPSLFYACDIKYFDSVLSDSDIADEYAKSNLATP